MNEPKSDKQHERRCWRGMWVGLYHMYATGALCTLLLQTPAGKYWMEHPNWFGFIPISCAIVLIAGSMTSTYFMLVYPHEGQDVKRETRDAERMG